MSASRRRPTSRFQLGMAAMYAWTGPSPSAFAIWGLPPARRAGFAATRLLATLFADLGDFLDPLRPRAPMTPTTADFPSVLHDVRPELLLVAELRLHALGVGALRVRPPAHDEEGALRGAGRE